MCGEEAKGFHVENEVRRRALGPELSGALGRQRVVGAVDLDQGKLRRVVAQPRLRAGSRARIEAARLDQRLVGPGRRSDEYLSHRPVAQRLAPAMPMRIAWPSGRPASNRALAISIAFARTAGGRFFIDAG
jgi:hypothetical protein